MRLSCACICGSLLAAVPAFAQNTSAPYAFWTLAGKALTSTGTVDGTGANARFNRPFGIAVDAQGNVYVTEAISHVVRKITPDGVVTTLAGTAGEVGITDGAGSVARFAIIGSSPPSTTISSPTGPFGLAIDGSGNAFVADGDSHTLRRISAGGVVMTYSGLAATASFLDGPVATALYRNPVGVAIDAAGNIFVADTFNHVVRQISRAGVVSTIAGNAGNAGTSDGLGSVARFLHPTAVAVSLSGNLYVTDSANTIRRLTPSTQGTWSVATIAGTAFTSGTTDGAGADARFGSTPTVSSSGGATVSYPSFIPASLTPTFLGQSYKLGDLPGIAADAADNVYVCDFSNNTIRKISPYGLVTTIGGSTTSGSTDGLGSAARFQRPCGIAVDAAGTLYIADSSNGTIRKGAIAAAPAIVAQSGNQTVSVGANITLSVTATGSPTPSFQWSRNGSPITGATLSTLALSNVQTTQAGTYSATIANSAGSAFTTPLVLTVVGPPVITTQPASINIAGGQTATLSVSVAGSPAPTYQWLQNGTPLPGQTNATLVLGDAQDATAAAYSVVVTNSLGSTTSAAAIVAVDTGRIVNLSIRSALAGSSPLMAGFVVAGGSKPLLIRAVGPALRQFGVSAAMNDPQLTLQVGGSVLSTNDNWFTAPNAAAMASISAQVGAFALEANSLDAAALATVTNNAATAETSARDSRGGIVLLELYDTGAAAVARLVNVSARAQVGLGENALFAGFGLGGNTSRTLLIRAIGPTLGAFGVSGTLSDPLLEIFTAGATTPRAANDNWNGDAALVAAFARVGAFPLPSTSSRDAALVITLPPGSYSAKVSGVGNTTGEALLEIYELP